MKPTTSQCLVLEIQKLVGSKSGTVRSSRTANWRIDGNELGIRFDTTQLQFAPIVPGNLPGLWATICPTCDSRTRRLWLAPTRSLFQCRSCAGVRQTAHIRTPQLKNLVDVANRIQRLRRRYGPVPLRRTMAWYRGVSQIVALEDRLVELATSQGGEVLNG